MTKKDFLMFLTACVFIVVFIIAWHQNETAEKRIMDAINKGFEAQIQWNSLVEERIERVEELIPNES